MSRYKNFLYWLLGFSADLLLFKAVNEETSDSDTLLIFLKIFASKPIILNLPKGCQVG
jgi:hypothetical protein